MRPQTTFPKIPEEVSDSARQATTPHLSEIGSVARAPVSSCEKQLVTFIIIKNFIRGRNDRMNRAIK